MISRPRLVRYGESYRLADAQEELQERGNRFLKALEIRGLSVNTVRAYGYDLVSIFRWLIWTGKELKSLTQADLFDFVSKQKEQKARPRSINRRLMVCYLFYRFCFNEGIPHSTGELLPSPNYKRRGYDRLGLFLIRKPTQLALKVKVPRTIVEPLKIVEVDLFLKTVTRYRDLAIVLFMLLCGLRSSEVLSLRLEDINFGDRQVRIQGKGGKERVLPLPETLVSVLQSYLRLERAVQCRTQALFVVLQGKRRYQSMTLAGLRRLFRYRRLDQKLCRANAHRFRHTFGTDMARSKVDLPVLQRMMGHADPSTTLQYIELSMADIADEYKRAIEKIQGRYGQLG